MKSIVYNLSIYSVIIVNLWTMSASYAANVDDLEVTIDLIEIGDDSATVFIDRIILPSEAAEQAQANAARINIRNHTGPGNNISESMRQFGQDIRDSIIDHGLPNPANTNNPNIPDNPGPPGNTKPDNPGQGRGAN